MEELGQIISNMEQSQEALSSQKLPTVDETKNLISEIANISTKIAYNNESISTTSKATNLITEMIQMIRADWLGSSYQQSRSEDSPTDKSQIQSSNLSCYKNEADLKCGTEVELSEATNPQHMSADDCPSDSTFGFDEVSRRKARQYIANKVQWWMNHKDFNTAENPYASIRLALDLPTTHLKRSEPLAYNPSSSLIKSKSSLKRKSSSPSRQSKRIKAQREREKFRVAMSGVSKRGKRKEIVEKLGGTVVESAEDATVLLAEKFLRTVKILVSIGRGIPIVGPDWLEASEKIDCFLEPWDYLLQDPAGEERFACSLKTSLQKSVARKKEPFLREWSIYVTKNVRPPPDALKAVVKSCGGKYINQVPTGPWPKNSRVISCEEDVLELRKMRNRPTVVKVEWILRGIVMQRIESDDKYELAI